MTASYNKLLATSNPAISVHFMFGFEVTIASETALLILSLSLSY